MDGSPVPPPAAELATGMPQVWTNARSIDGEHGASGFTDTDCAIGSDPPRSGDAVARVGVIGVSITRRATPQRLIACDARNGSHENGAHWCGRSHGRVTGGRLDDPRLDLGCFTERGDQIAFAWFQPSSATAYVAVDQGDFVEIYPVLARLPVRIASTRNVDLATSSASFDITEYDRYGRLVRSSILRTKVAG